MEFEMNLIQNAYDFMNESLHYYNRVGKNESHEVDRDDIEEKKKWKTAFILLVQAVELILKEKLYRINEILVYENIDISENEKRKTVSYSKAISRLVNLRSKSILQEEKLFLLDCGEIRNQCIHYKVKLNSIEIKKKYCKLFYIFNKLHKEFFNKKYICKKEYYQIMKEILMKSKDLVIFRGREYTKKDEKTLKLAIEKSQKYKYLNNAKNDIERVKYGDDEYFRNCGLMFCDECRAKQGEYHDIGCDLEECPQCGGQLITCGCFKYHADGRTENYNINKHLEIVKN